ncbi:MAG TPA: nucleoside hydrolase-like domain-containing protein [Sphingomonas sp.]|nr:nucleoside hydrolase-like domain-containing protein [Sphingomonas sp.]
MIRSSIAALAAATMLVQPMSLAPALAAMQAGKSDYTKAEAAPSPRSRVIVLTDIGSDPDDMESMVRFLLYSNEWDVEGLVAATSRHLKDSVHPEQILTRIDAYEKVLPNLRAQAKNYPSAQYLRDRVKSGRPEWGMKGVGEGKDTEASEWIIRTVDKPDPRPVWITIWGGAVDLAQALWKVRATRTPEQVEKFVSKLRVYSISDQDDAGPWVRRYFPDIFWIASITAHRHYNLSTWGGISGDRMYYFDGPDFDLVSKEWVRENIQRGPMGAVYPSFAFIMEGDSPSFLYLIPNGLGSSEHPDYGSWGGRYGKVSQWDGLWTDTSDLVLGEDGKVRQTNKATIWRWREAYQNDFAGRIEWTLQSSFKGANHNPELVLNGIAGRAPIRITASPGEVVRLSAEGSRDPDGDVVDYRWWQYRESEAVNRNPEVILHRGDPLYTRFVAPEVSEPTPFHIILEAKDSGKPALYAYRRAIVTVVPRK